jgi:hypothetical protein
MFKNKYLKYKQKYLDLKQVAGSSQQNNTFYIYTTGIWNWGHNDFIIDEWNNHTYNYILNKIPSIFTNIEISHHDILLITNPAYDDYHRNPKPDEIEPPYTIRMPDNLKIAEITEKINHQLLSVHPNNQKVKQTFTTEPINFLEIKHPHLIFDFAHLFDFVNDPSTHQAKIIPCLLTDNYPSDIYSNIKTIRLAFPDPSQKPYILVKQDYLTINTDGSIITYIDIMNNKGLPIDNNGKDHYIGEILHNKFTKYMLEVYKNSEKFKTSVPGERWELWDAFRKDRKAQDQILIEIFNKIMEPGTTREQIEDINNYNFYHEFLHRCI